MILVSPSGTTVRLSSGNLIDINGYLNTTFDDSASTPVPVGILLSGSYIPEEPLSTLNGEDANGGWELRIVSHTGIVLGTLFSWSITIE